MNRLRIPAGLLLFFAAAGFSLHDASTSCSVDTTFSHVPEWARHAVWYQIFPERFRNGDPRNDPSPEDVKLAWPFDVPAGWRVSPWTSDWYKLEPWETRGRGRFYENTAGRRYGGDLQGVIDRLDYIKELGISAIYFNPLFESPSHHKYDAALYHHIDKNFGPDPVGDRALWSQEIPEDPSTWRWSAADRLFLELISQAHRRGIRVIIDGVFNHVGTSFWAFRDVREKGQRSRYKDWFTITRWDDPATPEDEFDYEGWMGIKDLPEFREDANGIVDGPRQHIGAIVRRWMDPNGDGDPSDGIDGWRLDVAEKVAIPFWRDFRIWVRGVNPQAYITGEVWWEDWRNDKMFNAAPWLQGDVFDAVMNYRWAREACRFFKDRKNSILPSEFDRRLQQLRADYPAEVNDVLMNLYGSHDTDRLASMIVNVDTKFDKGVSVRDNPAYDVRKPDEGERTIQRLMVLYQMTAPGAPMVYYGDEVGMWGGDDPDCRKPMLWDDLRFENESRHPLGGHRPDDTNVVDTGLLEYYRQVIALRNASSALRVGRTTTLLTDDARGPYVFLRSNETENVIVALNRSAGPSPVDIPLPASLSGKRWYPRFGQSAAATGGEKLTLDLPAVGGIVLSDREK